MAELASQPTSIQSVYTWYREEKLFVNRRYQRKLVWTQKEKQKLIESLLKRYPIPAILIAERDKAPGTYGIIDGLQRLHAIMSFIENAFPLNDNRFFNIENFPTAKSIASDGGFKPALGGPFINAKEVSTILDYSLAMSVMRNATESEVNDVFDRINTYGHRLSDQERRQAGVQNDFSNVVRQLACTIRGDTSAEILLLQSMPSISIDLPMANHGYEVKAEEVFWVNQGILRSTDLRDSLDEQCLADIVACIVGGQLIERSKDALDEIYKDGSTESDRIQSALEVYGANKIADEVKYCIDEILKVCNSEQRIKLRDLIFAKRTTNAFPSRFAVILFAFHEIIFADRKRISDYAGVKRGLTNLSKRIDTGQRATAVDERRKNIDTVKGLIGPNFIVASNLTEEVYGNHTVLDIESVIRRSEIEVANYELKQGFLPLEAGVTSMDSVFAKIIRTICAIANNRPKTTGKILIGVTDKETDAERAKQIDGVEPIKIGKRYVVGVNREAKRAAKSVDEYVRVFKTRVRASTLSESIRDSVLSNLDYNSFYGLGIIVITIPPQAEISYVGEDVYWRSADATEQATLPKQIASIANRFRGS